MTYICFLQEINLLFRSSSVVEQSAVNRSVVGSSPTFGAKRGSTQVAEEAPLLRV